MNSERALGRVMLIDDDPVDQMIHKRILKRSGMVTDLVGFQYARDALDYLGDPASPSVNLILLDINMPAMNGFEFLEAARGLSGLGQSIPVVMMLTTSMSPDDQKRAEQYPEIRAYTNKPLDEGHLEAALEYVQPPG